LARRRFRGAAFPVTPSFVCKFGDIDFLVRPTLESAELVLQAIAQFGLGSLDISTSDLAAPRTVLQSGREPNRIDLMTSVTGVRIDAIELRKQGRLG
jgi:hypothetical protein